MSKEKCSTCKFWWAEVADDEKQGYVMDEVGSYCRRYPPIIATHKLGCTSADDCEFPIVLESNWCGEWKQALDDPQT